MRILTICALLVIAGGCTNQPPQEASVSPKVAAVSPKKAAASPKEATVAPPKSAVSSDESQKSNVVPGEKKTQQPETSRPAVPGQKVEAEQLRLHTSDADLVARTDPESVVAFVNEAERLANVAFGKSDKQFRVVIQFDCNTTGHVVKLAHQGDAPMELLKTYYEALLAAKKLPVREGEVSFELVLAVSPKEAAASPKDLTMSPEEKYHNPADQKTYAVPGGWKKYLPETPRPVVPGQKVKSDLIRLLTSEADTAARTDAESISAFVKEAERLANEAFGKSEKQFRVMAQFNCSTTGHEVKVAHQGDAPMELLQSYYEALVAAKKLPVREGEVSFQLEMTIRARSF